MPGAVGISFEEQESRCDERRICMSSVNEWYGDISTVILHYRGCGPQNARLMPFFFIVPLWIIALVIGIALTFSARFRTFGLYVVAVPTGATLISFLLSTAVLFILPRVMPQPSRSWYGVFLILMYLGAIGAGGLIGATTGFFVVKKLRSQATVS